jgi:hypothetical protein
MSMRISRKSQGEVHRKDDDKPRGHLPVQPASTQRAGAQPGIHRMGSGFDATRTASGRAPVAQPTAGAGQKPQATWATQTPHLQQPAGSDDCGATSIAMLMRAAGKGAGKTDTQLISDLDQSTGGKGMKPVQVGETLAKNGLLVTAAGRSMSPDKMKEAFDQGYKFVAKVNTGRLAVADKSLLERAGRPTGGSHYVVVDGMDDKGRLMVKDPQSSNVRYLTPQQLDYAMGSDTGVSGFLSKLNDTFKGTSMRGGLMAVRPDENALQKWKDGVVDDQIAAGMHMDTGPGGGARTRWGSMF